MNDNTYFIYIMSNKNGRVLYTGMTDNLERRVYEHKNHLIAGFTQKYNVNMLVYYECTKDVTYAITREKQIKGWTRAKKENLINSVNPQHKDLSLDF